MSRRTRRVGGHWIRTHKRHAIYHRDLDTCTWCGFEVFAGSATLDHLGLTEPEGVDELAGPNASHNLVTSCHECNSRRRDIPLLEWLTILAKEGRDVGAVLIRLERRHIPLDMTAGRHHFIRQEEGGWRMPF